MTRLLVSSDIRVGLVFPKDKANVIIEDGLCLLLDEVVKLSAATLSSIFVARIGYLHYLHYQLSAVLLIPHEPVMSNTALADS